MKAGIHPAYREVKVHCACGNNFVTRSTNKNDISVEICSACHPFFTGKQKLVDTAGRVERFNRKFAKSDAAKKAAAQPKPNLIPIFGRIDALALQLSQRENPELLHFLSKKSYEKARLLLAGEDDKNPRGTCR